MGGEGLLPHALYEVPSPALYSSSQAIHRGESIPRSHCGFDGSMISALGLGFASGILGGLACLWEHRVLA